MLDEASGKVELVGWRDEEVDASEVEAWRILDFADGIAVVPYGFEQGFSCDDEAAQVAGLQRNGVCCNRHAVAVRADGRVFAEANWLATGVFSECDAIAFLQLLREDCCCLAAFWAVAGEAGELGEGHGFGTECLLDGYGKDGEVVAAGSIECEGIYTDIREGCVDNQTEGRQLGGDGQLKLLHRDFLARLGCIDGQQLPVGVIIDGDFLGGATL